MFVLRMGGVADGCEVFGIAWRTADIFRRATAGGIEQEWEDPLSACSSNHFSSLITWSQLSPKS